MEILLISHKHPPTTGGMEKQSFELVRHMKQFCKVHQLIYKGLGSRLLFFLKLHHSVRELCNKHKGISIIHFNDALIACYYALFLTGRKNVEIKYAVTLHGLDVVYPSWLYRKFIFPKLNRFDLLLPVSKATSMAAQCLGIDAEKIIIVHNGVDEKIARHKYSRTFYDDFQQKHHLDVRDKQLLVAIGRPVKRKGFSWFIEHVLPKLDPSYLLLLIGPYHWKKTKTEKLLMFLPSSLRQKIVLFFGLPSDEIRTRKLLLDPQMRKRVKHLGRVPSPEVLDILYHAKAFVMPNIPVAGDMEGFGLVCLEASLCGTAVFAAEVDGIPDAIVNRKNGFLISAQDDRAWVKQLNDWLQNSSARESATDFRHYTLNTYSWTKMAQAYYEAFQQVGTNFFSK